MKFSVLNFHMGWGIASVLGKAKAPFLPAVGPFPQGRLQRVEGRLRREEGRPRLVGRHQLEDLGRLVAEVLQFLWDNLLEEYGGDALLLVVAGDREYDGDLRGGVRRRGQRLHGHELFGHGGAAYWL